jgi:hypothetical protein
MEKTHFYGRKKEISKGGILQGLNNSRIKTFGLFFSKG